MTNEDADETASQSIDTEFAFLNSASTYDMEMHQLKKTPAYI